jgi:phosphopantothenoylcysteine decarboxylase / phosphopantothenate---cysteine ligase
MASKDKSPPAPRAKPGRAKPGSAKRGRGKQGRAKQSRAKRDGAKQGKAKQGKAKQGRARLLPSRSRTAGPGIRRSQRAGRRLHIVITAGPTREHFDSVRFISNPSTGKMGYAIAEAAAAAGHEVTLVSGPVALPAPRGVRTISVVTAAEMAAATRRAFARADAAILVAAVCDYRPKERAAKKLPKSGRARSVVLVPTEDIAASLGRIKGERVTIAFAMEDHAARRHAERKLIRKNCDAIVLNGPGSVGTDTSRVEFLVRGGRWRRWPAASKGRIAERIMHELEGLLT